ncbi:hypothetical protein C0J45_5361 [Silurus meridionalis]|nr:hypothetical protein C0J45_5361 [Silurus meridionalis]
MARQRAGGVVKEGRGRGATGTGNATGTSAGVNGDPRVTRILAHTGEEHEPPTPAPSDPETPHKSTDLRAGAQDSGVMRERPHLPWEQMLAERAQNAVYCRDVSMPTPFHLSVPPYANAYPHSAFLLSLGAPPLGFPPVPQAALLDSRQEGPGFFYTPYLFHPNLDLYHTRDGMDGVDMSPLHYVTGKEKRLRFTVKSTQTGDGHRGTF